MDNNCIIALVVLACIFLDVVSGLVKALKNGEFSSSRMRKGLYNKVAVIIVLLLAWVAQIGFDMMILPQEYESLQTVLSIVFPAVGVYLILMEAGSVLENAGEIVPELKNKKLWALFGIDEKEQSQ